MSFSIFQAWPHGILRVCFLRPQTLRCNRSSPDSQREAQTCLLQLCLLISPGIHQTPATTCSNQLLHLFSVCCEPWNPKHLKSSTIFISTPVESNHLLHIYKHICVSLEPTSRAIINHFPDSPAFQCPLFIIPSHIHHLSMNARLYPQFTSKTCCIIYKYSVKRLFSDEHCHTLAFLCS